MKRTIPVILVLLAWPVLGSAQNFDNVQITTIPVADGIYMLTGQGGNLGLSVGEDGAFLIDDQFAPLTDKILGAIAGSRPRVSSRQCLGRRRRASRRSPPWSRPGSMRCSRPSTIDGWSSIPTAAIHCGRCAGL